MDAEDIKLEDWHRIIFGDLPPVFLIEVVLRVFFSFLVLMLCARSLSNRLASDLSRLDLITKVSLAASLGMPLQSPMVGLIPAVIVAIIAVLGSKIISYISIRDRKFEKATQDDVTILVKNGVMCMKEMKETRVTRERLLAELRFRKLQSMGEVNRLYIEANGLFTLLKKDVHAAGLSVIPDWDQDMRNEQKKSPEKVCTSCGNLKKGESDPCSNCGQNRWEQAVSA